MDKDDKECIKYILYQTKHGVSLEDVLRNLGYVKQKQEQKESEL